MKVRFQIKKLAVFLLIAAMLFAAGCSEKSPASNPPDSGVSNPESSRESQSLPESSARESSTPERSEEPSESSDPAPEKERRLAAGAEAVEGTDHLFDITALIPKYEGMTLTDFALQDQTHLLLLYKANLNFGEGEAAFTLSVIDLETGTEEILNDHQQLVFQEDALVDYYTVKIAGVNPPIVTESISGAVYYPRASFHLEPGMRISNSFFANDTLYVLTTQGDLWFGKEKKEDDLDEYDFAFGPLWSPGVGFKSPALAELTDDSAVFRTNPLADDQTSSVYLSVSLDSGSINDAYTLDADAGEDYTFVSKNTRVTKRQSADGSWSLAVIPADGQEYVSDFPKIGALASFTENGWFTPGQPADGSLCFLLRDAGEETVLLWDYACEQAQPASLPVRKDYDISALLKSAEEFAFQLEERFGIDLALREEAADGWHIDSSYSIDPENDEKNIFETLSQLQHVLVSYPDGFFRELGSSPLRIGIVKQMTGVGVETVSQANGLCVDGDPGQLLLRSAPGSYTIYHELGHVIFNKLCRDGFQSDMMGAFNELNPVGFIYSFSYDNTDPEYYRYTPFDEDAGENYENVYFSSDYAKISNTEDVAELMGHLLNEEGSLECFQSEHLQQKCKFLFERIRRVFDIDGFAGRHHDRSFHKL